MQISGQSRLFMYFQLVISSLAPTIECGSKGLLTFATFTSDEAAFNPLARRREPFAGSSGDSTCGGD
jgi:hypothetical protein